MLESITNLIKDSYKVIKVNIIIALELIKQFKRLLILEIIIQLAFIISYFFSGLILKYSGILDIVGITFQEYVIFFLLTEIVTLNFKAIVLYKSFISMEIEEGIFIKNLKYPINLIILDSLFTDYFVPTLTTFLLQHPLLITLLIFWVKTPLINIVKGYLILMIIGIFTITLSSSIRSLDLLNRNLTAAVYSNFYSIVNNKILYFTPNVFKNNKVLFYLVVYLFIYGTVFYLGLPAFIKGEVKIIPLSVLITLTFIFTFLTYLIWKTQLKKVEIYN